LPKPLTSGAKAAGRFGKQDLVYVAAEASTAVLLVNES
jgi:transposase